MNLIDWEEILRQELVQLVEQGVDLNSLPDHLRMISGSQEELAAKCRELYQNHSSWQAVDGYPYVEPSDLASIEKDTQFRKPGTVDRDLLFYRIQGAWLGRAAGCLLGKPVEGWKREEIKETLISYEAYPLRHYFTERFPPVGLEPWKHEQYTQNAIEFCSGMPRDDDMDYTILALKTVYGAMFIAAMNAAAFGLEEPEAIIRAGMDHIPQRSRLHGALDWVLGLKKEEPDWEKAGDRLLEKFSGYHRVHTINNAAIVALALLYGERDLEKTISIAVMLGLDTDCNGASSGSIIGIINGSAKLPDKWTRPLHDRIESYIAGEGVQTISKLALRSMALTDYGRK